MSFNPLSITQPIVSNNRKMILNFYRFSHDEIILQKVLHVRQVVNINFVLFLYKTDMLIVDNWVLFVRIITFILSNKRFIQTIMPFSKFKDFSQTYHLPRSREKKTVLREKKSFLNVHSNCSIICTSKRLWNIGE